jgi:hypothetical protein
MKPLAWYMEKAGISASQLAMMTELDAKLVTAVSAGLKERRFRRF